MTTRHTPGGALENVLSESRRLNRIREAAPELLAALESFVTQWVKLAGFPLATDPYSGAIVAARTAIARATGEE